MQKHAPDFIERIAKWAVERGCEPDDALEAAADIGLALRENSPAATDDDVLRVMDGICWTGKISA